MIYYIFLSFLLLALVDWKFFGLHSCIWYELNVRFNQSPRFDLVRRARRGLSIRDREI
jgi:hypothetical protein